MKTFSQSAPALLALSTLLLSACDMGTYTPPNTSTRPVTGDDKPPVLEVQRREGTDLAANEVRLEASATDADGIAKVVFERGNVQKVLESAPYVFTDFLDDPGNVEYTVTAYDKRGSYTVKKFSTATTFPQGTELISAKVLEYSLSPNELKVLTKAWSKGASTLELQSVSNQPVASTPLAADGSFSLDLKPAAQRIEGSTQAVGSLLEQLLGSNLSCTQPLKTSTPAAKIALARLKVGGERVAAGSLMVTTLNGLPQSLSQSEGLLLYSTTYLSVEQSSVTCSWPQSADKVELTYGLEGGRGWHRLNVNLTDQGSKANPRYKLVINTGNWANNSEVLYKWQLGSGLSF